MEILASESLPTFYRPWPTEQDVYRRMAGSKVHDAHKAHGMLSPTQTCKKIQSIENQLFGIESIWNFDLRTWNFGKSVHLIEFVDLIKSARYFSSPFICAYSVAVDNTRALCPVTNREVDKSTLVKVVHLPLPEIFGQRWWTLGPCARQMGWAHGPALLHRSRF